MEKKGKNKNTNPKRNELKKTKPKSTKPKKTLTRNTSLYNTSSNDVIEPKNTINISSGFIKSILKSFLFVVITLITFHLFGKWEFLPYYDDFNKPVSLGQPTIMSYDSKIGLHWMHCYFEESHRFEGDGSIKLGEIIFDKISVPKLNAALKASFDGHWKLLLIFLIIFTIIFELFRLFRFKVK